MIIPGLLLLLFMPTANAESGLGIDLRGIPNIGEELIYTVEGQYPDIMIEGYMTYKVTGVTTINVDGTDYECYAYQGYGEGTAVYFDLYELEWTNLGIEYLELESGELVAYEGNFTTHMPMDNGKTQVSANASYVIPVYSKSTQTNASGLTPGDTWMVTEEERVTRKGYEDNTLIFSETETESRDREYKYVGNFTVTTDTGTYDCRLIKSYEINTDEPNTEEYHEYVDKATGIPVKIQFYKNDTLTLDFELTDQIPKIDSGNYLPFPSDSEPGAGSREPETETESGWSILDISLACCVAFIGIILLIIIAVIIIRVHKNREPRRPEPPEPHGETPRRKRSGLVPKDPLPPPGGTACPECGGEVEYVKQFKLWYCENCKRYK